MSGDSGPCSSADNFLLLLQKFLDSSKLKRHFLIHTGERDFVCPHEGCGKVINLSIEMVCSDFSVIFPLPCLVLNTPFIDIYVLHFWIFNELLACHLRFFSVNMQAFSLDFNLRSHMKTHSQENYHVCPYPDCGKRYAHEYKLKNHIASHHEKVGNLSCDCVTANWYISFFVLTTDDTSCHVKYIWPFSSSTWFCIEVIRYIFTPVCRISDILDICVIQTHD